MTSIDPSSRLASVLREQLSALRENAGSAAARKQEAKPDAQRTGPETVFSLVQSRVGAIRPDDPDRKRKIVRAFLEHVFLREFGGQIAGDPSFARMLDAVQEQMQQDAQVSSAADELVELLQAGTLAR